VQQRRRTLLLGGLGWPWVASQAQPSASRVISLGGSVTETLYALGQGARVVACDLSSVYPQETQALPKIGYYRNLTVEGVASLRPDLILASDQAGPPAALQALRDLGIAIHIVPDAPTLAALRQRIAQLAHALAVPQAGEQLIAHIDAGLAQLPPLPDPDTWPRALSIIAHSSSVMAAGAQTAAGSIMQRAGVRNVLHTQRGYKPVSAEAALALAPDVLITTRLSIQAQGGATRFLALPMLAHTRAAQARHLVVMEDLLYLSLGPRLPQAVQQLRTQCAAVLDQALR